MVVLDSGSQGLLTFFRDGVSFGLMTICLGTGRVGTGVPLLVFHGDFILVEGQWNYGLGYSSLFWFEDSGYEFNSWRHCVTLLVAVVVKGDSALGLNEAEAGGNGFVGFNMRKINSSLGTRMK